MNTKSVIDTNVLVSSMISKDKHSPVINFMTKVFHKEVQPIISDDVFAEYKDVLLRPKFNFSKDTVNNLFDFLKQNAIVADPWDTGVELPDPSDLPFFEAYVAEQSPETFLVTGNTKHYPDWPYIVTPRQIVDYLGAIY